MKIKMLIVLLSLLAWSWFNQLWLAGGTLLIPIGGRFFVSWHWQINRQQFHRIGDLVTLLILFVLLYSFFVQTDQKVVFIILKWLPAFFAPVLFAQLFNDSGTVPLGTLFYSVRKRQFVTELDFKIPYAGLCLLSAGVANDQTSAYFIVFVAIFILILWTVRSRQDSMIVWCIVIAVSAGAAFWGQKGLRQLHSLVEEKAVDWLSDWQTDPFKTRTSIGDIGELKLSDRVEFRVKATEPLLLHQSSYDRIIGQSWYASKQRFKNETIIQQKIPKNSKQLVVFQRLKRESILALPAGTVKIKGLEGATLQYSELGAVKLTEAPEFVNYQVSYSGRQQGDVGRYDLDIPQQHQNWIELIQQDLKLEGQSAKMIAQSITGYFQKNYFYSLFLGTEADADNALQTFILNRKAGHCEYFAVASVLLLRSYGIPARLANGYSMQEYDETEHMFIVRRRHAHAWAIAYIDGFWQAVDSTPSQWADIEEENAELFQPVYDWFSSLMFTYKQWQYQQAQMEKKDDDLLWIIIVFMLLVYLGWRLYSSRLQLIRDKDQFGALAVKPDYPGRDSELYLIEQVLSTTEKARLPNEPFALWANRINSKELIAITKTHYSYRFDPQGISESQRNQLKIDAEKWLN